MRSTALIIEPTPPDERDVIVSSNGRNFRSPLQIERDREYEARAYLSGRTMREIAEHLSITVSAVSADIMAIRDEWANSRISNYDMHVNIELAKIDALEQTYWQAYYDSQKERRKVYREIKDEPSSGRGHVVSTKAFDEDGEEVTTLHMVKPKPLRSRKIVSEVPAHGNLTALAGVERCIERRCKLLGLDAPTKVAPTTPDGKRPYDPISNESRAAAILSGFLAGRLPAGDAPSIDAGDVRTIDGVAIPGRTPHD